MRTTMIPMRFGRLLLPVSLFALAGCQLVLGFEDHTLGAGGAGGDTGAGAGATTTSTMTTTVSAGGMGGGTTTSSTGGSGGAGSTTSTTTSTTSTTTGGTGGGSTDPGINCPTGAFCTVGAETCCYDRTVGTGVCQAFGASCTKQRMDCDDKADCLGTQLCCARYQSNGNLADITCKVSCSGGMNTYETWCDPTAPTPCPAGMACTGTSATPGYMFCE